MFKMKKLVCLLGGCSVIAMPALGADVDGAAAQNPSYDQLAAAETSVKMPRSASSASLIEALLDKARYWKAHNRMDLAASTWERVLRSDPKQPEALAGLGLYQASIGRSDLANEYLARLKQVNSKHPAIYELERALASAPAAPAATAPAPTAEAAVPVDPAAAARAKQRSQYFASMNQGEQARKQGRLDDAGKYFRAAAGSMPEMPEAPTALADLMFEQGDQAGAEAAYRKIMAKHPGYSDATLGLARIMVQQKKYSDALALMAKLDSSTQTADRSAGLRAEAYLRMGEIAEGAGNSSAALDYYGKARSLRSSDPWVTLSFARSLRQQGQAAAANKEIERMTASAHDRDANYAGALFYAEENQWVHALALLDQIDAQDRNANINELRSRAVVYVRSDLAKRLYDDGSVSDAVEMMSSAENDAAGKPELVSKAAATWSYIGQPERAIALLERSQPLTAGLQVQYAGALLQTNQDAKLEQLLNEIDSKGGAAASNAELDRIRIAHVVRKVDALRQAGKVTEGAEMLMPQLAKYPQNDDLQLAKARLQGAAGELPEAFKTIDAVLARTPGNHEAIRQGAEYAIRQNDYELADKYLSGSSSADTDRAELYVEAAHQAEARQNNEQAAKYYKVANDMGARVRMVDISASPDRQLAGSEAKHNAYVEGGYAMRYKTGLGGMAYMYEKEVPVSWHVPLEEGRSSLVFKAADVKLDASGVAAAQLDLFGTNNPVPGPIPGGAAVYPIKASGVALSAGYQSDSISADIGVSPMGFQFNDVVGGLRWNKDVAGSNVAVEVTRRSVTESVLSYAGAVDNNTGLAWGGVAKTGGQVSVYYPFRGAWAGYASAGLYDYSGKNVANNSSNHLNATLIYEVARTDNYEATISARVASVSFNNNQNWFFWGHGGYYSPQRDVSLSLPVHVAGKTQKLNYEVNVSGSVSNVNEAAALTYPTDPVRQAALGAAGLRPATTNGGKGSWNLNWTVEYEFAPKLVLGNRSHYDESPTYQQVGTMFYLRYDFDKKGGTTKFPPNPIRPYYVTTQGGAGLN